MVALGDALASVRESWEPETTARNLRLIREARERHQDAAPWAKQIEEELERKAEDPSKQQRAYPEYQRLMKLANKEQRSN